jgi:hypothetical protein
MTIVTDVLTTGMSGAWRRLRLLSSRGSLEELAGRTRDDLRLVGLELNDFGLLMSLKTWWDQTVPPAVALSLWRARSMQLPDGSLTRSTSTTVVETNITLRFVQLSLLAGGDVDEDVHLRRAIECLRGLQLPDGSFASYPFVSFGEVGTTARILRVLRGVDGAIDADAATSFLIRSHCGGNEPAWSYDVNNALPVTGATSLAIAALADVAPERCDAPTAWLIDVQNPDGGWSERPGNMSTFDNTFNAVRALITVACRHGNPRDCHDAVEAGVAWIRRTLGKRLEAYGEYDLSFALRTFTIAGHSDAGSSMADTLVVRAPRNLSRHVDLYVRTLTPAIAIQEWVRTEMTRDAPGLKRRERLWRLQAVTPAFLVDQAGAYDILSQRAVSQHALKVIDVLSRAQAIETAIGTVLGFFVALQATSTELREGLARLATVVPAGGLIATAIALNSAVWAIRLRQRSASLLANLVAVTTAYVVAAGFALLTTHGVYAGTLKALWYGLVISAVSAVSDASGLTRRLAPH